MTSEGYSGVTTGTVATACSLAAIDAILDSPDIVCVNVETPKKSLDILIDECPFVVIDEIYEIDSYEEGNWYCYYLFADGDVYVVTLKNNHVDVCVQLN